MGPSCPSRFVAGLLLTSLAGCGGSTGPSEPPPLLERLPRPLTAAESAAIAATNQFAFRLLGRIVSVAPAENAFVSPLSVSLAFGMVMNGARNATRDSLAAALGFGARPQAEINEGYRTLIDLLRGLDTQVDFTIANSVWAAAGFPVSPAFLDDARRFFDAEAQTLDFRSGSALTAINGWVNDKTRGKIPTILEQIDAQEVLFAVNAIYFKGFWRDQFKKSETAPGPFHAADGSTQTVSFMHRAEDGPYFGGPDFDAVDLWYGAGAHTMTIIVPTGTTTATELARRFGGAEFETVTTGFREAKVELWLPRFRLEYQRSLKQDLAALGMGIAFDPFRADFSGIATTQTSERLYLTRVEHKTFVDVNEEGTEAAAATAVGVGLTSAPLTKSIRVDRPFLLAIRERLSGTIVFLGRINAIPTG